MFKLNPKAQELPLILRGEQTIQWRPVKDARFSDRYKFNGSVERKKVAWRDEDGRPIRCPMSEGEVMAVSQSYESISMTDETFMERLQKRFPDVKDVTALNGWKSGFRAKWDMMPLKVFIESVEVLRAQDITEEEAMHSGLYHIEFEGEKLWAYRNDKTGEVRGYRTALSAWKGYVVMHYGLKFWRDNCLCFVARFRVATQEEVDEWVRKRLEKDEWWQNKLARWKEKVTARNEEYERRRKAEEAELYLSLLDDGDSEYLRFYGDDDGDRDEGIGFE